MVELDVMVVIDSGDRYGDSGDGYDGDGYGDGGVDTGS